MVQRSRALAVVATAGLAVSLWAMPAQAETASEPGASGAYFSSTGIAKPDAAPAAPPNVTADVDGVAPGKLAVAARGGEVDKVSFLYFALADVAPGSVVSRATLTVPLVASDASNVNVAAEPAKVRACKAGPQGFGGEDGAALALAPERLCDQFSAPAKASEDGTAYVFDLTALAATWVEANDGVALAPADGADRTTFQVVLESADKAMLSYEYTPAPETGAGDGSAPPATDGAPVGSTDSGAGSTDVGGSFAGTTDVGTADLGGGFASVEAPALTEPLSAVSSPEVAGDPPVVAVANRGAALPLEVLSPTAAFWLAAVLLAGGLAFLSLVLGDGKSVSTAAEAQPSRLTQALAARRTGRPSASLLRSDAS